jgi:hypothetical protein
MELGYPRPTWPEPALATGLPANLVPSRVGLGNPNSEVSVNPKRYAAIAVTAALGAGAALAVTACGDEERQGTVEIQGGTTGTVGTVGTTGTVGTVGTAPTVPTTPATDAQTTPTTP